MFFKEFLTKKMTKSTTFASDKGLLLLLYRMIINKKNSN